MRPTPHPRLSLATAFAKLNAPLPKPPPVPPGLGTWINRITRPIARLSDRHLGTKLVACIPCKRRQNRLDIWHHDQRLHARRLWRSLLRPKNIPSGSPLAASLRPGQGLGKVISRLI